MGLISILATVFGAFIPLVLWLIDNKAKRRQIQVQQERIENRDVQLTIARRAIPDNLEVIENVNDVLQNSVLEIIRGKASLGSHITIDNFGLDLESVMPWINNNLVHPEEFTDIQFTIRSLIINPQSIALKDLINGQSNITTNAIKTSIANAKKLNDHKKLKKFDFVIREYSNFPMFHGFIINEEHLFVGFTQIEDGKLIGGVEPYLHVSKKGDNQAKLTKHYFRFFTDWFKYYWEISHEVVNVKK